ncbi:shikimate dehydrogenase [Candidatus Omnitrophota bacterium]
MADNEKKIYGLVGFPIGHSLSPKMHNAAFQTLGLSAEYQLFSLKPEELDGFVHSLAAENIHGFNVTVPYKELFLKYLSWKSLDVETIGAVNTVRVINGNYLKGYNTDGWGFFTHLKSDLMFNPKDKNIAIIGAGGGAKAVCAILAQKGVRQISIFDLDAQKSTMLAERLQKVFSKCIVRTAENIKDLNLKENQLLVNATPVGLKEDDSCLITQDDVHKDLLVYDLIYNPPETKLLKVALQGKAKTSNGLGMLFYQGTAAFERFTDFRLTNEVRNEMWRSLFT